MEEEDDLNSYEEDGDAVSEETKAVTKYTNRK